jgi:hypothetical protein
MAQCNILEALRYVEDLYNSASDDKSNKENKQALRYLFEDINEQRAYLQQIASFAGVKALDITKPRRVAKSTEEKVVEDTPPWEDPGFVQTIKENFGKYGTKIVEYVKSKKEVSVKMDKQLAVRIMKNKADGFALHTLEGPSKSVIQYPDFDALLEDEGALRNIANEMKLEVEDVRSIALNYRRSGYLQMTKLHEHIHAGAIEFMSSNPKDPKSVYVNNLYQKMLKLADSSRPSLNDIQEGYWKTNVDEFLAVALSNPEMMAVLNEMPATGFTSTLHKLVNTLASMVGIKQGSENEALLNVFLQMTDAAVDEKPQLNSPSEGGQIDLFQGIPIGELNAIIEQVNKCKSEG